MKNLSLKFRMMFFSTVMVILVVSSISAILFYFHHKAVWEEFGLRVESLSRALSKELELVVLLEDKTGIERLLKGALALPDVLSVSVWAKKDKLLLQKGDASFVPVEDRKIVECDVELENTGITAEMMEPMAAGKTEKIGRLVAVFSAAKLKTRFMKMIYSIIIVTLVVIFLRLLADYLFIKGITKPIEKLVHGSESVANGDLTQRIDIEEGGEIGKLALTFNKMVASLCEREAELQASNRGLQRSFHELAATNEELLFAKKNAEAASEAKSEFLATMSHELRTPLTAIIGFTQLLLGGALKPEQMDYLNRVNGAGRNLLKLVNEMLDLIQVEKDELKLEITGFHLTAVLESNLRPLAFKAHRKGLEFLVYISPDTPVALEGDPGRLVQVLVNLVDNAIKFTKAGEVTVLVTLEGHSQNSANILFSVRDTGIGISKAHQEIVFERFRQADGSSTRKYGGMGLGATISRQLVELMGGRIWMESEEGIGSAFNFSVQFKIPAGKEDETAGRIPKPLPRLRVLVVDDNGSSRRILHRMLDFWSLKAEMCASGQEAIDMIIEAQAKKDSFDVCLLDLQMPAIGGAAVVERLKEKRTFPLPKFIMLSQTDAKEIQEKTDPAIQFLAKPLFHPELYRALLEAVEGKKGLLATIDNCPSTIDNRQSAATIPIKSPFVSLKDAGYTGSRIILIVEDNSSNRELVKCALEIKGFRVEIAENGKVALDIYEEKGCDLILMDIQMPVMDGFEATAAIREKEKGAARRIPIIALTAHAMKGDRERCLKAGMDGYVSKPVDLRELIDTVNRHL